MEVSLVQERLECLVRTTPGEENEGAENLRIQRLMVGWERKGQCERGRDSVGKEKSHASETGRLE